MLLIFIALNREVFLLFILPLLIFIDINREDQIMETPVRMTHLTHLSLNTFNATKQNQCLCWTLTGIRELKNTPCYSYRRLNDSAGIKLYKCMPLWILMWLVIALDGLLNGPWGEIVPSTTVCEVDWTLNWFLRLIKNPKVHKKSSRWCLQSWQRLHFNLALASQHGCQLESLYCAEATVYLPFWVFQRKFPTANSLGSSHHGVSCRLVTAPNEAETEFPGGSWWEKEWAVRNSEHKSICTFASVLHFYLI